MTARIVYIHGVTETGRSHRDDYRAFRLGLVGRGIPLPPVDGPESFPVEWGWDHPAAGQTRNLAAAQAALQRLVDLAPQRERTSPRGILADLVTGPLRRSLLAGPGDLAYYLSDGGEERVREVVWRGVLEWLVATGDEPIDLTIIAHSAGALIAHDFLFWLFSGARDHRWDTWCPPEWWVDARRRVRLRRLVTLGSPFTATLVRSVDLVDRVASHDPPWLEPEAIGLDRPANDGRLPIWLNVWDRHDLVSFPVAGIYRTTRVRDLYPDVSDWPPRAHGAYWSSHRAHAAVAAHWMS